VKTSLLHTENSLLSTTRHESFLSHKMEDILIIDGMQQKNKAC